MSFQKGPSPALHFKEPRFAPKVYKVPVYRHISEGSLAYKTEVNFRVLQWQTDLAEEDHDFRGQPSWTPLIFSPTQSVAYVDVQILNDNRETEGDESFHIEIQRDDRNYIISGCDSLKVVIENTASQLRAHAEYARPRLHLPIPPTCSSCCYVNCLHKEDLRWLGACVY